MQETPHSSSLGPERVPGSEETSRPTSPLAYGENGYSEQHPLHAAARVGNFRAILDIMGECESAEQLKLLLAQKDEDGDTPLHSCFVPVDKGGAELKPSNVKKCVAALLTGGADVNARDSELTTPLHACALRWDDADIISLLLDAGADPVLQDDQEETAEHYAEFKNHVATAALLQNPRQRFVKLLPNSKKLARPAPVPAATPASLSTALESLQASQGRAGWEPFVQLAEVHPGGPSQVASIMRQQMRAKDKFAAQATGPEPEPELEPEPEPEPERQDSQFFHVARDGTEKRYSPTEHRVSVETRVHEAVPPEATTITTRSHDEPFDVPLQDSSESEKELRLKLENEDLRNAIRQRAESMPSPDVTELKKQKSIERQGKESAQKLLRSQRNMWLHLAREGSDSIEEATRLLQEDQMLQKFTVVYVPGEKYGRGRYMGYKRRRKGPNLHTVEFDRERSDPEQITFQWKGITNKQIVSTLGDEYREIDEFLQSAGDESALTPQQSRTRTDIDQGLQALSKYSGAAHTPLHSDLKPGSKDHLADSEPDSPDHHHHSNDILFDRIERLRIWRTEAKSLGMFCSSVEPPKPEYATIEQLIAELPGPIPDVTVQHDATEAAKQNLEGCQQELKRAAEEQVSALVPRRNKARREYVVCVQEFGASVDAAREAHAQLLDRAEQLQRLLAQTSLTDSSPTVTFANILDRWQEVQRNTRSTLEAVENWRKSFSSGAYIQETEDSLRRLLECVQQYLVNSDSGDQLDQLRDYRQFWEDACRTIAREEQYWRPERMSAEEEYPVGDLLDSAQRVVVLLKAEHSSFERQCEQAKHYQAQVDSWQRVFESHTKGDADIEEALKRRKLEHKEAKTTNTKKRAELKRARVDYEEKHDLARDGEATEEEEADAHAKMKSAQVALKAASRAFKDATWQLHLLCLELFPELALDVKELQEPVLEILSTGLTLESYDEKPQPLFEDDRRNQLLSTKRDGKSVLLKQYRFTYGHKDNARRVANEVKRLHEVPEHKNIVEILAHFKDPNDAHVYVEMPDYRTVGGRRQNLKQWLEENRAIDKAQPEPEPDVISAPMPAQPAVRNQATLQRLMLGFCNGVAHIHEHGISHNDIKLTNVVVYGSEGREEATLCDFEFSTSDSTTSVSTVTGGTHGYMAPERSRPPPADVERDEYYRRCDMYSVGIVLLLCNDPAKIEIVEGMAYPPLDIPAARYALGVSLEDNRLIKCWEDQGHRSIDLKFLRELCQDLNLSEDVEQVKEELQMGEASDEISIDQVKRWWSTRKISPQLHELLTRLIVDPEDRCSITETMATDWARDLTRTVPRLWSETEGTVRLHKDCNKVELTALQQLLETVHPSALGTGKDCGKWPDIPPPKRRLLLAAAWRLQHRGLYSAFSTAAATVQRRMQRSSGGPPCRPLDIRPELIEAAAALSGTQFEDVNEHMLLHTVSDVTKLLSVIKDGTNERFAGGTNGANFGDGSYFAEDAAKCDQCVSILSHSSFRTDSSTLVKWTLTSQFLFWSFVERQSMLVLRAIFHTLH